MPGETIPLLDMSSISHASHGRSRIRGLILQSCLHKMRRQGSCKFLHVLARRARLSGRVLSRYSRMRHRSSSTRNMRCIVLLTEVVWKKIKLEVEAICYHRHHPSRLGLGHRRDAASCSSSTCSPSDLVFFYWVSELIISLPQIYSACS